MGPWEMVDREQGHEATRVAGRRDGLAATVMGSWHVCVLGGGVGDVSSGTFHVHCCAFGQGARYGSGVCVMVNVLTGSMLLIMFFLGRKLLEFVVDNDTGHLTGPEILDVPTWALPKEAFIPRIRVDSGMAPYAYISLCSANKPRQSLIFDPRYRRWYKFPRFRTRLVERLHYTSTSRD